MGPILNRNRPQLSSQLCPIEFRAFFLEIFERKQLQMSRFQTLEEFCWIIGLIRVPRRIDVLGPLDNCCKLDLERVGIPSRLSSEADSISNLRFCKCFRFWRDKGPPHHRHDHFTSHTLEGPQVCPLLLITLFHYPTKGNPNLKYKTV